MKSEKQIRKKIDIILYSNVIKSLLKARITELDLTYREVVEDAVLHKRKGININSLSRYFSTTEPHLNTITHENVVWLCFRYGVNIKLSVSLETYDYNSCINKLNKYFK